MLVMKTMSNNNDCYQFVAKVPDLELLMDQSRIRNAQDYKHKCEIQYRSSHMNEDKSRVLMYNNPPPDLNNWTGEETVGRYMPSWADDESVSLCRNLIQENCENSIGTKRNAQDKAMHCKCPFLLDKFTPHNFDAFKSTSV